MEKPEAEGSAAGAVGLALSSEVIMDVDVPERQANGEKSDGGNTSSPTPRHIDRQQPDIAMSSILKNPSGEEIDGRGISTSSTVKDEQDGCHTATNPMPSSPKESKLGDHSSTTHSMVGANNGNGLFTSSRASLTPTKGTASNWDMDESMGSATSSPAKSTSSRGKSASVRRPEPTFVTSRTFAPLPVDPPLASSNREGSTTKRSERKSKTDAMSAINGKDATAEANPPTSAHHPSRKPLGALTATYTPLPLYAPPDRNPHGWKPAAVDEVKMKSEPSSAPASTTSVPSSSSATIPTQHNTPRRPPPRQRGRLFDLEEAPTFYPTPEEFSDPLKYIKWIGEPDGGNGKEYGIVKVVPPEGWKPTFVLDQQRFRFRTRVQRLNSLSADARASLNYQEQLQKFHAQQGHARVSIPVVDRRPVDLYQLKLVVATYGGYDAVARQRKWAEVTRRLGYDEKDSCHLAAQIKAAYSRIIYPFERFLEANRDGVKRADLPPSNGERDASVEIPTTPTMGEERSTVPPSDTGAAAAEDVGESPSSSMNMRRRSSRRKTDPKDAPVILSHRARRRQPSPPPHGTNGDFYIAPGAEEQMCEICLRGDDGVSMLLCDECNRGYHMFCLDPPLSAIPRSEWFCPACLVGTGNDYGFDDGETHSLSSFWKRADGFRSSWWSARAEQDEKVEDAEERAIWRAENGKANGVVRTVSSSGLQVSEDDVEREFWRLVHNPDETVEVEYGADVHSTTHGSALPTLETHPLDPYSRDGWNLNNLPILNGSLLRYIKSDISGMTVPWVYVGMMFSTFCWHNEDHYTYSINYQHFGDTKTWYGIPGSDAHKLEDALRKAAPDLFEQSPDLLFQLVTMMSPDKLRKEGVRVYAIDQRANEFVITYPKAYHSGFNQGFNLNEAVNFALPDWIDLDLNCVRRYQQYKRFPVFSHDELIVTVYQHSQTVDTAMWLQDAMREMVEREIAKRDAVRAQFTEISELEEDTDLAEAEYQCSHCNIFCYLGQITSEKTPGIVACLDHGSEVCGADLPSSWTLRLRFGDEQLRGMLAKTVERASVPANWQARLHKVIVANARPALRSLRGLLHEGEKIPYPIAELNELREFVEKANRWVDEATAFIAKRHQKRAGTGSGARDAASGRRGKRLSKTREEDESMTNAEDVEQLGEPEKVYMLLTEAELLPFDAPEIAALQGVVAQMEEFKHCAKELLDRVKTGSKPKLTECDEVIALGSTLSVRLEELDQLQMYVNRRKWHGEIEEARNNFFTLEEIEAYIEEGFAVGVSGESEHMDLLHDRMFAGQQWKKNAESVLEYTSRDVKRHSCNWRVEDVETLTKASYKVAIVPDLHIKLEQLLKHVRELAKQCASLLQPVETTNMPSAEPDRADHEDAPVTRRYVEAKRFLDQVSSINVVFDGEGELAYRVAQHDRWQSYFDGWLARSRTTHFSAAAENRNDPMVSLDNIRKLCDRAVRINAPSEREPGLSPRKCICRSDEVSDVPEVTCTNCDSIYHTVCLGLQAAEVKGRKGKTFVCPFCDPEKLSKLLSGYASLPDVSVLNGQMPLIAAPFGKMEAQDKILHAQDMASQFEAEVNRRLNYGFDVASQYGSRLLVHLLKRSMGMDFANVRVSKYNKTGVKILSEILFAHKGLGPEGQTATLIPWRGIAPGDPRFAPNARRYNPVSVPAVKQEVPSSPIATQPSPVPQPRLPGFITHQHASSSSPHAFERGLPPQQYSRPPVLPASYGGAPPYPGSGPSTTTATPGRLVDEHRPMLPMPMQYSMRYEQPGGPVQHHGGPPMRASYQYQPHAGGMHSMSPHDYHQSLPPHSSPSAASAAADTSGMDSRPQPPASPTDDDGKDDGRKRKRGKRARFVFQEEVGIFVPVNGERIYCLCRRGETGKMISCDRCALWFHYGCVHIESADDLGAERWICPMCCVKTERRYPFGEVKVKEMGVSDPTSWLDVRATLRSTRGPVSKRQHWTVGPNKRIVLHLESFYPATLPSSNEGGREGKRQRSVEQDGGVSGRVRSGSQGSASSSTAAANANALGSVSRMPSWNDVRARITPVHRTPSAEEQAARMQREAEERHLQGMANLYSRGVTDAMIRRWYIGWNGKELVYPLSDSVGRYSEICLGPRIKLAVDDHDGSRFMDALLRQHADEERGRREAGGEFEPGFEGPGAGQGPRPARPAPLQSAAERPPLPAQHASSPSANPGPLPPAKMSRPAAMPISPSPAAGFAAVRPMNDSPSMPAAQARRPAHPPTVASQPEVVATRPIPPPYPAASVRPPPPPARMPIAGPAKATSVNAPAVRPANSATPPPSALATGAKRTAFAVAAIPPFRGSGSPKGALPARPAALPALGQANSAVPRPRMVSHAASSSLTGPSSPGKPASHLGTVTGERFAKSPSMPAVNAGIRSPAPASPLSAVPPPTPSPSSVQAALPSGGADGVRSKVSISSPLHHNEPAAKHVVTRSDVAVDTPPPMDAARSTSSPASTAKHPQQQRSYAEFRALAQMMKPGATDSEIDEMVRHAMSR